MVISPDVRLYEVELSHTNEPYKVTDNNNNNHLDLKANEDSVLWKIENIFTIVLLVFFESNHDFFDFFDFLIFVKIETLDRVRTVGYTAPMAFPAGFAPWIASAKSQTHKTEVKEQPRAYTGWPGFLAAKKQSVHEQ